MKKLFFCLLSALLLLYLLFAAYIYRTDSYRPEPLIAGMSAGNARLQTILNKHGCESCHKENAPLPFYASLPIAAQLTERDISRGTAYFLLDGIEQALREDSPAPQADLAKLEAVMLDNSMPPQLYQAVHWGSGLSEAERQEALSFIRAQRLKYYAAPNAAENMKTEPVQPIAKIAYNADKALLGEKLFNDVRISHDNTVSCASCHNVFKGGGDDNNKPVSLGIFHQPGPINAPTVLNAIFNHSQFWNGRAATLEDQALVPPFDPVEGGSESYAEIIAKFKADPVFTQQFEAVYHRPFDAQNNPKQAMNDIISTIAEYEKTLITPSRFDLYLQGNPAGITPEQKRGYRLFKENRCATCHVGRNLGGVSYEPLGLAKPYFSNGRGPAEDNAPITEADLGRYMITYSERDKYRQKVPGLRNLSLTYPYFHRGNLGTIHEAVTQMLKYQVGRTLPEKDVNAIVAFLKSLDSTHGYARDLPKNPLPIWQPPAAPK